MMLKRISKSSVMLRGAVAPDVSKDHVHGHAKNVICTVVTGVEYTGC
jgi:hypothetical protein